MTEPNRIFSAIQRSGTLTLGNYLGAVRNWVELQRSAPDAECLYCVARMTLVIGFHRPGT